MQGLKGKARARAAPRRSVHDFVPAPLRPSTILLGREVRDIAYRAMNVFSKVNARPLFVLGNQKSGTTAIAALLAEATGRSVTLDLAREVWNPTFHKIPSGELAFDDFVARNRWGFSREIVKEPNLTLFYPELVRTFPEATFLFVLRDPRDNIRSLLNRLNLPGDLDTLPEAAWSTHNPLSTPGWGVVFDARWRGIPGEHYIDRLAHRWRFCVEVYQANAARMNSAAMRISSPTRPGRSSQSPRRSSIRSSETWKAGSTTRFSRAVTRPAYGPSSSVSKIKPASRRSAPKAWRR